MFDMVQFQEQGLLFYDFIFLDYWPFYIAGISFVVGFPFEFGNVDKILVKISLINH